MLAALTMDLVDSRKYDTWERNEIQYYIIEVTEVFNRIFSRFMLRELKVNNGDEIQGLFPKIEDAYICLRLFRRLIFPIKVHAGIGVGEWTTVVKKYDTYYQDGSAYHNARDAVQLVKRESDYSALIYSGQAMDAALNAFMNSGFRLMDDNTAFQNDLAVLLECIFPVYWHSEMDGHSIIELQELMKKRNSIEAFAIGKRRINRPIFKNYQPSIDFNMLERSWQYDESRQYMIYKYAHPFGAASSLAEATGLTRQSIDTALKASNVYAERAVAIALLKTFSTQIY